MRLFKPLDMHCGVTLIQETKGVMERTAGAIRLKIGITCAQVI